MSLRKLSGLGLLDLKENHVRLMLTMCLLKVSSQPKDSFEAGENEFQATLWCPYLSARIVVFPSTDTCSDLDQTSAPRLTLLFFCAARHPFPSGILGRGYAIMALGLGSEHVIAGLCSRGHLHFDSEWTS
jgi:hypothetical protein